MVVFGSVLTASTTADTVLSRKLRVQPRATIDETRTNRARLFIFRNKLDRPHVVIAATVQVLLNILLLRRYDSR